jgi:mevalonate kinase
MSRAPSSLPSVTSGRAFGKAILLGEHAVVYGAPAIAVGLERGVSASARSGGEGTLRVGDRVARAHDGSELGEAFGAVLTALGAPKDVDVEAELEFPAGSGLGASAALAVAVTRAIQALLGDRLTSPGVAADAWERVFHANPSGIDAAVAAEGGCIEYRKSSGSSTLPVARELVLAVAVAGAPKSTKQMVERVRAYRESRPVLFDKTLGLCESLVLRGRRYLASGDLAGLGATLDSNHDLLCSLGVSTDALDEACSLARRHGALGAKLTGAGGGGSVIALTDGDATSILSAWSARGFKSFQTRILGTAQRVRAS